MRITRDGHRPHGTAHEIHERLSHLEMSGGIRMRVSRPEVIRAEIRRLFKPWSHIYEGNVVGRVQSSKNAVNVLHFGLMELRDIGNVHRNKNRAMICCNPLDARKIVRQEPFIPLDDCPRAFRHQIVWPVRPFGSSGILIVQIWNPLGTVFLSNLVAKRFGEVVQTGIVQAPLP